MKHLKRIDEERAAKYNQQENRFVFDTSEKKDYMIFYLHDDKNKKGFAMDITLEDKDEMAKLLTKNNINFTMESGNVLPF